MDEPTAALSGNEVARLFAVARTLRDRGCALLFISHRLEEIFELCARVTTLRDGRLIATEDLAGLTPDGLMRRMVGRDLDTLYPRQDTTPGEPVLEVARLTREGVFTDVSFAVRAGEIVALAGLVGAGRSEVARAVFGVDRYDAGAVRTAGRPLPGGSPTAAMAAGIALVPEDRRQQGLVMDGSIERNIGLTTLRALRRGPARLPARRTRPGRRLGDPAAAEVHAPFRRGRRAVRRQPAEGRARQVALHRARTCSSWTSRPAASTSAPRPRCTGCCPSWPPTAWPS